MGFNYQIILFLICLFLIYQYIHKLRSNNSFEYKNNHKEIQKNNKVDVDIPLTTTISQQLSENKLSKNKNEIITPDPEYLKHDIISPNPENTTELRFVDEDNKGAWSSINVSQHPKYYTSNFTNELTNVGAFFKNNQFNDNTSAYSKNNLPDRCLVNDNHEIICNFNNKLQNIPPQLIEDDNQFINQLGNENIYKGMCNIGHRPTFYENADKIIEVHLFSRDSLNLYDKNIILKFKKYLRKEKKYNSSSELIQQLTIDRHACFTV